MLCIDSNIIIDIFRGESTLLAKIGSERFAVTPVIACELYKGAYAAQKKTEALKLVDDFLSQAVFLEFVPEACRLFGQIYAELKRKGKRTSDNDLMIASVCVAHNVALVTRNKKILRAFLN